MTAVITTAMLAGPLGYLLAGPLLEAWGPNRVILLVATGQLLATLPFARVAFRPLPDDAEPPLSEGEPVADSSGISL
jgi:hypothetical protein